MQKKKETPNAQELRDQPVPPVKGAVTDWQDAVVRPDRMMGKTETLRVEPAAEFGSWL